MHYVHQKKKKKNFLNNPYHQIKSSTHIANKPRQTESGPHTQP